MENAIGLPETRARAERVLIQRCVAGELRAWRQLHREHFPAVQRFLQRMGVDSEDLDDTSQEVFLQLFRSLGSFRREASLKTFLYRVCMTHAARQRRRTRLLAGVRQFLLLQPSRAYVDACEVSDQILERRLQSALEQLSSGHRAAFVLFEFDGLCGKEIAEVLGCPEPTLWRRLHEARRVVRLVVEGRGAARSDP